MIQVNVSDAKAQLSELIAKVLAGEKVIICKHNKPMVELVSRISPPKRELGKGLLGMTEISPEFFEPMSDEELEEWERPIGE